MKKRGFLIVLVTSIIVTLFGVYSINSLNKRVYNNKIMKQEVISEPIKKKTGNISLLKEVGQESVIEKITTSNYGQKQEASMIESEEVLIDNTINIPLESLENSQNEDNLDMQEPTNELDMVKKNDLLLGTVGRLFIPSVDLNVGVYNADITKVETTQKIVDNRDSAAYFHMNHQYIIADHNYQGFNRISDIPIGGKAYIKKANGQISVYRMTNRLEGENLGYDLTDLNGKSVLDGRGDLIMYTCYKTYEYLNHVMIVIWELES